MRNKITYTIQLLSILAPYCYQQLCSTFKVAALLLCCLFSQSLTADNETKPPLTILSGEWPPYVGESLPSYGFVSQIVAASFAAANQPINYKWLPWTRGEALIKRGRYFATFPYSKTDLREQDFVFSEPVFYTRTSFFYYKEHNKKIDYTELKDIKHLRIGGIRGYGYLRELQQAKLELYLVNNTMQLIEMLERDRIDLIAINDSVGWYIINHHHTANAAQFDTLDTPINDTHGVHLMISKDFPHALELRAQFNKGLAIIHENGVFQKIVEQLMPKDFKSF